MSGDKRKDEDLEDKVEYSEELRYKRSYVPTTDELDDENPPSDDTEDTDTEGEE